MDFVVSEFNDGCRGMTLLSAIDTSFEKLPTLIVTSKDQHASAVAYANGARICHNKSLLAAMLVS